MKNCLLLLNLGQAQLISVALQQYYASNPSALEVKQLVDAEIDSLRKKEQTQAKGTLTTDHEKQIIDKLVEYVVNRKPRDLMNAINPNRICSTHEEDWKWFDERGHWNWKNSLYPIRMVAELLGLIDECHNTSDYELNTRILDKVKRNKEVKKVKDSCKKS